MRIISWNVNGIRAVEKKGDLSLFLEKYAPDVFFLQEIKGTPDKFSENLIHPEGYVAHYNPAAKAGYAGTGVWIARSLLDQGYTYRYLTELAEDPTHDEWRISHLELTHPDGRIIDIFGIYFPNGGKSEAAWHGKLIFYRALGVYLDHLRSLGHLVLWGGDLNCAHHPIDLARPKENDGKIGFHPAERAWLDDRVDHGWLDLWRVRHPGVTEVYSWWDQVTRSRERNVGWRIDAWWGDLRADMLVKSVDYHSDQYGSDHCPLSVEIDF